jgi:periplasmic divalent cation tolerance protein
MALSVLYIPCANENQAQKVAWHLISLKLVACAHIFPVTSIYSWKEKVMNTKEFVIIAKSAKSNFEAVKKEVRNVHSYEVPCVVMWDASANDEYMQWVHGQLGNSMPKHHSVKKSIKKSRSEAKSQAKKRKIKKRR